MGNVREFGEEGDLPYYVWIALGSAFGGMMRYWIGTEIARSYGTGFPWGTWVINVLGSFTIGFAATWADHAAVRFFVMVGLCGGFTTFSSFSLETLTLLRLGEWQKAFGYVMISVLVCVAATLLGSVLGRRVA